jgi:TRAP-type C4-dicarboxylate transport system substrate-binding protein
MIKMASKLIAGSLACASLMFSSASSAQTQQVKTLRVGNWLPTHHLIVAGILKPWADAIETETNGTLKLQIMGSPLGPPPATFDLLLDGAFDIGYGVSGHNPGRFTMTQVMDLPFASPDPWSGAAAAWATYERYGARYNEHKGAHVVGLFVHSTPAIHMRTTGVNRLADLNGKKIRVGGNVTGRIMSALGATPVQLPPTEAQTAMARGVADGITFPMESIDFFGITPVIQSSLIIPGGLYTDTFWIAFNQKAWDGLSDAHKAAVRKHSGMAIALQGGWAWTNGDELGRAGLQAKGVKFVNLPDEDVVEMKKRLEILRKEWLAEAAKRKLPGEEILAYAESMVQRYSAMKKVNRR